MITLLKKFQKLRGWQRIRSGAIATLLLAALSPIYATQKSVAAPLTLQNQYPLNVTVEDVAEDPEEYIGRIVTVRSEPDPFDGSNAFELDDEGFLNLGLIDDDEILVLNPYKIPFPEIENNNPDFQVTGEVRSFVLADIEREFGIDLDPDLYADYENEPVIVARSIALTPDPGEVTENPQQYYGRAIAVEGEVERIYSPYTFTLNDDDLFGGEDLLVLNASPQRVPAEDEDVVVVGELRPFVVADLERDYDLNWDLNLQRQLEVEYQRRPVMVIREVYPSAE